MEQTPSCKYFRLLADEYIEGELTGEEMREFEAHIAECPECRKEFEELRALKEMLAESDEEISEGLHERIISAVAAEVKPQKGKYRVLRRAAVSAACAVICLSLTLIFALMPLWREAAGSSLPEDHITDEAEGEGVILPSDTNALLDEENSVISTVDTKNDTVNAESPEQASTEPGNLTQAEASVPSDPEAVPPASVETDELTASVAESDAEAETIIPETAMPVTEACEEETDRPSTDAPSMEMTDAPAGAEPSTNDAPVNTSASAILEDEDGSEAPSAESSSAPGGDEITLALLIVSGLLAVASFIAFLISLSSVRNIPPKKNSGEEEK